jgi:hypothetical protein
MNHRLLLQSLLAFLFASLATSQPTDLVISALVDGPTFSLVELTACSYIPDFYPYEFSAHFSTAHFNGLFFIMMMISTQTTTLTDSLLARTFIL